MSASSARTTGSASPQCGHSKSPNSITVTAPSTGPRMWSRSMSTAGIRSWIRVMSPSRALSRDFAGSSSASRYTTQVRTLATTAADSAPSLASSSRASWNARVAISSATVKPMPEMVPLPITAAHPIGGRTRPRLSRVTTHEVATTATGLPTTYPMSDAESDRRRVGVSQEVAVQPDARVGQREQRDDHVARPRVVEGLQPLVGRQRRAAARRSPAGRTPASAPRGTDAPGRSPPPGRRGSGSTPMPTARWRGRRPPGRCRWPAAPTR